MSQYEGCSPYGLAVAILIGFFVGREESPEPAQALWRSEDMEGLQVSLPLAPSPLHYRILSSVIAQQLHAVDRAEEKTLGQLQDEIRDALPPDGYALSVVDRLTTRLRIVRSLDDLVDLVHYLNQLLLPPEDHSFAVHGRERPMYLKPNSVFGVFLRRIRTAFDGASFSKISLLFEDVARYTAESISISGDDTGDGFMMDIESPTSPRSAVSQISFGLVGSSADIAGTGGSGHIEAFLRSQSLEASGEASPKPSQLSGERRELDDEAEGVLAERGTGAYFPRSITSWQLQRRLQEQVIRLENGLSSQIPFEQIEGEIQAALGAHSDVPKAHFLRLINCMHHRDLQGSLDSLHRYFDYPVRRGGPSVSTADGFLDVAKGTEAGSGHHKPQHASLALARLHFEFGHLELASVALGEAIRVAQQGGDKACVAHAMSWLHQVLAAQGHPRAGDVLRRCAAQAADLGLHDLAHSTALLLACEAAEAKNGSPPSSFPTLTTPTAFSGGGVVACASPTRVWECLSAAASGDIKGLLESEAGGVASEGGGGRAVMDKAGGTGGEVAGARACQRLLVEAGAFERYGYTEMAVTCARSVLQVHGEFATGADIELASAHVMSAILQGKRIPGLLTPSATEESTPSSGGGTEQDVPVPEPATPGSSGKLPRWKNSMSEGGPKCVFHAALSVALKQHEAYPHPVSNVWAGGVMRLLHEWMVNRGELVAAEGLGMTLRGCCPLSQGAEAFVEAHLQRVKLLRAQGRWAEAVRAASALARLSDSRGLAPQYARLLLELSRARLEAEPASPVGALPHALRCLAVCESFSLDAIHASAMTHLAEVHLRMGSTQRARVLMRACLGQLLVNAPVQSQGEAWLAMAKCEIAVASLEEDSTDKGGNEAPGGSGERAVGGKEHAEAGGRVGCLRRAVLHLDSAVELLKRCHHFSGVRECWYLKARVWGEFVRDGGGEFAKLERNAAAKAFLAVSKAGVRALAVASPGLKIGPAEIERYMVKAMATVPWELS